jgi:hypothetical protein
MYMTIDKYQHPFRFYSLSLIIPWICWFVAAYLSHLTPSSSIYISIASLLGIIGLVSPMVIAFSMMLPDPELRSDLFNRLFTFKKIKPIYLLATFFLMLASILLAQGISLLFGYSAEQFNLSHGFSFTAARLTTINWKAPNIINTAGRVPYRLTSCQKNGVMVPTRAGINLKKSKYIKPLVRCLPISFILVSPLCFPLKLFFGLFQRSDSYVPPIRP